MIPLFHPRLEGNETLYISCLFNHVLIRLDSDEFWQTMQKASNFSVAEFTSNGRVIVQEIDAMRVPSKRDKSANGGQMNGSNFCNRVSVHELRKFDAITGCHKVS